MSAPLPRNSLRSSAGPVVTALMEEAHRAAASGARELARQRYESALYLLRDGDDASTAATILRRIARCHIDDGNMPAAMDCLHAALAVAEAVGSPGEIAHTQNAMAVAFAQRGMLEDAEPLYAEAARTARLAGDETLVAMTEQNLGVLASMRGDVEAALEHHLDSVARYRALGQKDAVARQLSNIGLTYAGLGRESEADEAYAEALEMAQGCGDTWTRLMVEVNRIALCVDCGRYDEAREACERVLSEATALGETRVLAETYKHYGVIARESFRFTEAEQFLQIAYEQALAREDLLLAAETAREKAELFISLGRNRDTLQTLSMAHGLFSRIRATRDMADVNARLRSLEQRFDALVRKWAQDIESKDAYTLGHCERVAEFACEIARDMGINETEMFWFRVGALLHDVGKIVVPPEILNKPGKLTPEERAWMERHPVAGAELLRDIDFPWDVLPMIRGHHERWDGHGYPDGLAGDTIPRAARILCVADVFDALTSDRPYRAAYSWDDALRLMSADSGRAFDPEVLERFIARHTVTGRAELRLVG